MTKNVNGFNKRNNRGAICKMFPYYSPPAMMMLPIVVWGSFVANDKNLSVTSRKRKREAGEVSSSVQGGDPEPQIQLTFENPVQLPSASDRPAALDPDPVPIMVESLFERACKFELFDFLPFASFELGRRGCHILRCMRSNCFLNLCLLD